MKGVKGALYAVLLLLVGCFSNGAGKNMAKKTPQVLRFNIQQEPSSLDPRKVSTIQDINVCRAMMDGLYRTDKEGKLQPALAQSHTVSPDGLTYTFYLRDAHWSNGTKITAQDFVYSWKSLLSPNFPSHAAYHLYPIKNAELVKTGTLPSSMLGIEAKDDKTLIVTLSHPEHNFPSLTAHPIFYPVSQAIDKSNPKWVESPETFVASGPFIPVEWKHHYTIIGKKNPNYWDAHIVQLDQIEMVMVSSETEARMYEANELDWTGSPISSLLPETIQEGDVHTAPFLGTKMIRVNVTNKLLASPKIRKAFSLAIDRKALSEHIMYTLHDPAFSFVPQCMGLHSIELEEIQAEEIQALFEEGLAEAGIEKDALHHLTLSYNNEDQNKKYAEAIQEQWRNVLGVEVALQSQDRKVLLDTMVHKQYDFILCSWIADIEDPINFLEIFQSALSQANRTGWENKEYASLIHEATLASTMEKRNESLRKSEQILLEEAPVIPLTHYSLLYKYKPNVHDVVVTPLGYIDFKWAHIEGAL